MNKGTVSVVVPVYKVEQYLDRCVSSIVNQTYPYLEIILVDDGSPDNCPQICDRWAQKDSRIRVIHKENAGLGMARNTGMASATGEYICFVDSDDYISSTMVEMCYYAAQKESADIVCFGNDKITQDGRVIETRVPGSPQSVFAGSEVMEKLLPMTVSHNAHTGENWKLSLSACFTMFSAGRIRENHWSFVSEREIISEDFYSVLEFYSYVKKAVILPDVFYHYTTNPASLTQSYRQDRYHKICVFYGEMLTLAEKIGCREILQDRICNVFLGLTMGCLKQLVASNETFFKKYRILKKIFADEHIQSAIHEFDFSGENLQKKILYWIIRNRLVLPGYTVVWMRNQRD